jgi:hypothetical protein
MAINMKQINADLNRYEAVEKSPPSTALDKQKKAWLLRAAKWSSQRKQRPTADAKADETHDDLMTHAANGLADLEKNEGMTIPRNDRKLIKDQIVAMWEASDAKAKTQSGLKVAHVLTAVQVVRDMAMEATAAK